MTIKCYMCGGIFDENRLIYTKDPDELMCPLCHAVEPGFSEVKDSLDEFIVRLEEYKTRIESSPMNYAQTREGYVLALAHVLDMAKDARKKGGNT